MFDWVVNTPLMLVKRITLILFLSSSFSCAKLWLSRDSWFDNVALSSSRQSCLEKLLINQHNSLFYFRQNFQTGNKKHQFSEISGSLKKVSLIHRAMRNLRPLLRRSLFSVIFFSNNVMRNAQAFINYSFSYTRVCARKTVQNRARKRPDVHATNNNTIRR